MNNPIVLTLATAALLTLTACEDKTTPSTPNTVPPGGSRTNVPGPVPDTSATTRPDNTANNHPDRATSDKTPIDQSNSQADIDITAGIRSAIMKTDGMSTNAQNCKIITQGGVVTLRGPVNSQSEKDSIDAIAKKTAGVTRVENLLEVVKSAP